jgi:hypothetical protein
VFDVEDQKWHVENIFPHQNASCARCDGEASLEKVLLMNHQEPPDHEPDCPANDGMGCRCGENKSGVNLEPLTDALTKLKGSIKNA